jgi:transcription termination factor Rho
MGGFLTKSDHMFRINKMKTNRNNNPTIVHEVQSDFVCLKENFGINSKIFHSDASIKHFEISKGDALNGVEISKGDALNACSKKFQCEYDKWSPNESMR